jgi:hypothetical protein
LVARRLLLPLSERGLVAADGPELLRLLSRSGCGCIPSAAGTPTNLSRDHLRGGLGPCARGLLAVAGS